MAHPRTRFDRFHEGEKRARKAFAIYYGNGLIDMTPESHPAHFGSLRKTRKFCSNPLCCGNPRRTLGGCHVTMQERRAYLYDPEAEW